MSLHTKGRSLLISTSSCASLGDVKFYGLQDPPSRSLYLYKPTLSLNLSLTIKGAKLKHYIVFVNKLANTCEVQFNYI